MYVKATQNSTSTIDKTVGYLDRSQRVGRWLVTCERKEGRGQSLSFVFLLPDPCIITGH
jgi:hypothetical protein